MENTAWYKFYKDIFSKKDFNDLLKFLEKDAKKSIRINTDRISIEDFKKEAEAKGWHLTQIPWCKEGFWINRDDQSIALGKFLLHYIGYFYMQESSSMLPATLFDYNEEGGLTILDMAAAPGSKTTQIYNNTSYKSLIVSNEPATTRLKAMASNLERMGTSNVIISKKDGAAFGPLFPNTFNKILLDAPCSGDGMMRKDSRILNSWTPQDSLFMAKLQKKLILSAFEALKPGGELVYSTCTFSPYENEHVIQHLINKHGENIETESFEYSGDTIKSFEGVEYDERINAGIRIFPSKYDSEGFFAIKITKLGLTPGVKKAVQKTRRDIEYLKKKKERIITSYLKKHFGIEFDVKKRHVLVEKNHTIWMSPRRNFTEFSDLHSPWIGMKLGEMHRHDFKISHSFALEYGKYATKHVHELSDEELADILLGKDIKLEGTDIAESSIMILKKDSKAIGVGKFLKGKIKNLLPRSLILKSGTLY